MTARCLLVSAVLHGAVLGIAAPTPKRPNAPIEVTILAKPARKPTKKHGTEKALNLKPAKEEPRLGSDAYRKQVRSLGTTLAAEHYLDRLHQHIDPHWHALVDKARQQATCITVVYIDADANGTVLSAVVVQNTCPTRLRSAAEAAIWQAGLLPPPKLFLDATGTLKLEWSFLLKRKD